MKDKLRFGRTWCARFYKRHKFVSRIASTKIRDEIPADYEAKKEKFELHLSKAIHEHDIPDELVTGGDETNSQFVPSVNKTWIKKGTRRVRLLGIGKEKPQITVNISHNATGDTIKPVQLIFDGKTNRCHPNNGRTVAPPGQYYEHTITGSVSHWQTVISFIVYVSKVLIPYRTKTIQELGLNVDQKMVYTYDLHYSHKDASVLALLDANNIIPIFISAGCTDLHQVCDVCINKPYKNGVEAEFIDYLSMKYTDWYNSPGRDEESIFKVNLSLGVTKSLIPNYLARGISRLETEEMKESIVKCFKKEGLLDEARL